MAAARPAQGRALLPPPANERRGRGEEPLGRGGEGPMRCGRERCVTMRWGAGEHCGAPCRPRRCRGPRCPPPPHPGPGRRGGRAGSGRRRREPTCAPRGGDFSSSFGRKRPLAFRAQYFLSRKPPQEQGRGPRSLSAALPGAADISIIIQDRVIA